MTRAASAAQTRPMPVGEILGLHHIKIPVSDLPRSRSWCERVFELEVLTELRFETLNENGADPAGCIPLERA